MPPSNYLSIPTIHREHFYKVHLSTIRIHSHTINWFTSPRVLPGLHTSASLRQPSILAHLPRRPHHTNRIHHPVMLDMLAMSDRLFPWVMDQRAIFHMTIPICWWYRTVELLLTWSSRLHLNYTRTLHPHRYLSWTLPIVNLHWLLKLIIWFLSRSFSSCGSLCASELHTIQLLARHEDSIFEVCVASLCA